jgi:hypothetical protein
LFDPLKIRNFRLLWIGETISVLLVSAKYIQDRAHLACILRGPPAQQATRM